MSHNRTQDYIAHIRQAIVEICDFVEQMDFPKWLADRKTQQAVMMNLIVIGEATTKIMNGDDAFFKRNPHLPWIAMKGMRNRLAHGYFEIDLDTVWNTVHHDLPKLLADLETIEFPTV